MSSLFTVGETRLTEMGRVWLDGGALDLLVGGLGLGYPARAALAEPASPA